MGHKSNMHPRLLIITRLLLALAIFFGLQGLTTVLVFSKPSGSEPVLPSLQAAPETGGLSLYLPVLMRNYPPPLPIFGVEVTRSRISAVASKAQQAGISWVRYSRIRWDMIESVQGSPNWALLDSVKSDLQTLRQNGLEPIVVVHGTPSWAQKVGGHSCGPIKADNLDEFATFMRQVVAQLSVPPYQVKYWELGNEEDVDPSLVPPDSGYGCWGDNADDFYGGGYYAEMLKAIYPAIKAADPTARVVFGGLLLDCDPGRPPSGQDCKPARFLEGALRNGGGNYFDVLAYHAYPLWPSGKEQYKYQYEWDLNSSKWSHRRGILLGKLDFLRETMASYGINKPVMMNEGGLLCDSWEVNYPPCTDGKLYKAQGNYAIRMYTRSWANNLLAAFWYTLDGPGWREGGLLDVSNQPRPAYRTINFLANLLKGSEFKTTLSTGNLEGYAFSNPAIQRTYWVYWTNSNTTQNISLPPGLLKAYRYNPELGDIEISSFSGNVTFDPIILEIGP